MKLIDRTQSNRARGFARVEAVVVIPVFVFVFAAIVFGAKLKSAHGHDAHHASHEARPHASWAYASLDVSGGGGGPKLPA